MEGDVSCQILKNITPVVQYQAAGQEPPRRDQGHEQSSSTSEVNTKAEALRSPLMPTGCIMPSVSHLVIHYYAYGQPNHFQCQTYRIWPPVFVWMVTDFLHDCLDELVHEAILQYKRTMVNKMLSPGGMTIARPFLDDATAFIDLTYEAERARSRRMSYLEARLAPWLVRAYQHEKGEVSIRLHVTVFGVAHPEALKGPHQAERVLHGWRKQIKALDGQTSPHERFKRFLQEKCQQLQENVKTIARSVQARDGCTCWGCVWYDYNVVQLISQLMFPS